ncbi:MAG TPA: hypothetical protein VLN44_01605, partial [Pyrinomonadaceae bacterium]|nr:hypothetical protein [Pyrinomonadaceae bacterium]
DKDRDVTFTLSFPTSQAIYDDLVFTVDGVPVALRSEKNGASGIAKVAAGKTAYLKVGHKSQGLNDCRYSLLLSIQIHSAVSRAVTEIVEGFATRDFRSASSGSL